MSRHIEAEMWHAITRSGFDNPGRYTGRTATSVAQEMLKTYGSPVLNAQRAERIARTEAVRAANERICSSPNNELAEWISDDDGDYEED